MYKHGSQVSVLCLNNNSYCKIHGIHEYLKYSSYLFELPKKKQNNKNIEISRFTKLEHSHLRFHKRCINKPYLSGVTFVLVLASPISNAANAM